MMIDTTDYPTTPPYGTPTTGRRGGDTRVRRPLYIPLSVIRETSRVMQLCGSEERECYAWWGGYENEHGRQVVTAYWPTAPTSYGRVHLRHSDLLALHRELASRDQVLLAELHTHPPGAGGQNEVDAEHAAAPYRGFISIVVPDFARPRFHDPRDSFVYEYEENCRWRELPRDEVRERLVIEEDFVEVRTDYGTA